MDNLFRIFGQSVILLALVFLIAIYERRQVRWQLVGLALIIEAVDVGLMGAFRGMPPFNHFAFFANWNWSGKTVSAIYLTSILAFSPWLRRGSGFTGEFRREAFSKSVPVFALVALLGMYENTPNSFAWNTLAFQASLPSAEELFFRGIGLFLLTEALGTFQFRGLPAIPYGAILTCVWFGLAHAVQFQNGQYAFATSSFVLTGLAAILFVTIRLRTGSIWLPMVAHSLINIVEHLPAPRLG